MEGRKRAKTDAPPASGALQAVEQLIQKLSACLSTPDQSASRPEAEAPQLGGLITELLALQQQLGGTTAQGVLDQALGDVLRQLEAATEALQAAVDRYTPPEGYQPPVAGDEGYVRNIIAYAHRLSYTTFAPPGFVPGQTQLGHFKPPAPQEAQFRVSDLHTFQRDYEAGQLAAKQAAARAAAAAAAAPAAPAGPAVETAALPPSLEDILKTMPAGWKPGDLTAAAPPGAAPAAPVAAVAAPQAAETSSEEEEEEGTGALPPIQRPQLASAFNLALNPGMEMEFGVGISSDEDDSDEESD